MSSRKDDLIKVNSEYKINNDDEMDFDDQFEFDDPSNSNQNNLKHNY